MRGAAPVLWDVVEEHLDEAAFLASQWEAALHSPLHSLGSVASGPEERLQAHVDGLLTAGAAARARILEPALAGEDRWNLFAAALALLESPGREPFDAVVERLRRAAPDASAALVRALELARRARIEDELLAVARSADPACIGPALDALAFRHVAIPAELLLAAEATKAPGPTRAAASAARWAGPRAIPLVDRALTSPVAAVRDAAIETGLVLGLRSAWTACRRAAEAMEPACGFPLLALALGGENSDAELIIRAAAAEPLRAAALFALGFTGRVSAAEAALAYVRDEKVGRIAAEAFAAITGLTIEGSFQAPEPEPKEEPLPFEEEDLDANLVPGLEAMLPLAAPDAVEAWWKTARAKLDGRARYVRGKRYGADVLRAAFLEAPMRRRHALGLDLAVRSRGEVAIQTRGWAAEQLVDQDERSVELRPDSMASYATLLTG